MSNMIVNIVILLFIIVGISAYIHPDTPKCHDFNLYMTALEKAAFFCNSVSYIIDSSLAFGIFLTKVNIKWALKLKLPPFIQSRVRELAGNFEWLSHVTPHLKGDPFNTLSFLDEMPSFRRRNKTRLYDRITVDVRRIHKRYYVYEAKVLNIYSAFPGPDLSDLCIEEVLHNPREGSHDKCGLDDVCLHALIYGDNYGFALSHRLLLLILMRQARSCYAFSEKDDDEMLRRFCSYLYHESKYIMENDGVLISLVMESIALCSMAGFEASLDRKWLNRALEMQSGMFGCFFDPRRESRNIFIIQNYGDPCNLHLTSVIMSSLSIVIRYLAEKCFTYDSE